jgi:methylmalonyl-CoA mutase N-terminal domain/subunit
MYDLREQGIDAPQEVAFGLGMAMCYIDGTLKRGLSIDQFAPRMAFYCSSHIDFFEEVAKLRAARKLWAKILKEKYGAEDPRSLKFRFAVHTAGCSLVPQQPLNNAIRVAYQAMAAVLAGVQSLHCCSYDEPIALPTEESQLLALRTQQILAYETGVARVADPLGGSYYIESLTKNIEEKAEQILKRIEELGGMYEAMRTEWIDQEMEKAALTRQQELEEGKQIIVGVNAFVSEAEKETPGGVHRIPPETSEIQARRVTEFKQRRDISKTINALEKIEEKAKQGEEANLMPEIIEAVKANATLGEIVGVMREAFGYGYDPLKVIENPFK